jgi:hypothetical protein
MLLWLGRTGLLEDDFFLDDGDVRGRSARVLNRGIGMVLDFFVRVLCDRFPVIPAKRRTQRSIEK